MKKINRGTDMKDEEEKRTRDGSIAEKEPPITASRLLEEILPLLEEYFIGEIGSGDNCIIYSLPNGQKFKITAELTD